MGEENPVDLPTGAESGCTCPPAHTGGRGPFVFSPRPARVPWSKKKDTVPWKEWYATYKERMKAAKALRETSYSFKWGEEGSPLKFECLHWGGEEEDSERSVDISHVGIATESIDRAWATLASGKAALRRSPTTGAPVTEEHKENTSAVQQDVDIPETTSTGTRDVGKGNTQGATSAGKRDVGTDTLPKMGGKDYRIYNDSDAEIEASSLFAYYVGAERLSGILKEDARGPAPYISVRVAAISTAVDETTMKEKILVKSWKDEVTTEMVANPLLFRGTYNNIPVRIAYDPGSGAQIMSKSFAEGLKVSTVAIPSPIRLRYPDGQSGMTRDRSTPGTIRVQGVTFQETFLINPYDIPGVDLILGLSFQNRVRSEIRYPKKRKEAHSPYISFPTGERIYPETWTGPEAVDCAFVAAEELHRFIQQEYKKNKTLDDLQIYAVSVQKAMQLAGQIPIPETDQEPEHPDIVKLRRKYSHIFATDVPMEEILKRKSEVYHKIPLKEGTEPVKIRPIPLSAPMLEIARELIADAVRLGLIEPGDPKSAWGAPIIILRKGGNRPGIKNAWRLVTDFRALNQATKKSTWTPPAIRDILDDLVQCKYFSITDCTGGFYQLPLDPEDKDKTTFRIKTPTGMESYRFTVSCLGLAGCPATYQQFMDNVVDGLKGVRVYLDDIVYFSKTWKEHLGVLEAAFKRFEEHKVFLHPLKCKFGLTKLDYLGVTVSKNRIQIAEEKIAAIKAYTRPDSYPALHRFLGFANYLAPFVPNYAGKVAVLTDLLQGSAKKKKFVWTDACTEAFDRIRDDMANAVGLGIPDKEGDLVLETDASGVGIGACLYQFVDGRLVPLWYLSRKLNRAEQNYSSRDREALAVVYSLVKLEAYLLQKPFVLYSDHQSLIYLQTQEGLKNRDWRWQEIMSRFSFEQRYKKGELMFVPDALSRAFDARKESSGVWQDMEHTCRTSIEPQVGVLNAKLKKGTDVSQILVTAKVSEQRPESRRLVGLDLEEEINAILHGLEPKTKKERNSCTSEVLHIATRIFGDLAGTIKAAYEHDPDMKERYRLAQLPADELTAKQKAMCRKYSVIDGLLYFTPSHSEGERLCVPRDQGNGLRLTMLFEAHDAAIHCGYEKTLDRLQKRYWWKTMARDCRSYCNSCKQCKRNSSVQKRPEGLMEAMSIPDQRWDVIHADWVTDLPKTAAGFDTILVVHDKVTKYAYLIPASKTDTAEVTAKRLFAQVFCVHGLPKTLVSDRDPKFTAAFFAQLLRIMNVKQSMGTAYQHDYNGAAERLNRTIEVMLRHVIGDYPDRDFDEYLPLIQWAYNSAKHSSTGMSPYYAMWGYEPRHPLEMDGVVRQPDQHQALDSFVKHQQSVLRQARDALFKAQETMEVYENRTRTTPLDLAEGDEVFLSTKNLGQTHLKQKVYKLQPRFLGPFRILKRISQYTYQLDLPKSMNRLDPIFHVSLLWKHKPEEEELQHLLSTVPITPRQDENQVEAELREAPQVEELETPTVKEAGEGVVEYDAAGNELFNIEKVLDRRKSGRSFEYLVKWRGYEDDSNTWLLRKDAVGGAAKRMLRDFDSVVQTETAILETQHHHPVSHSYGTRAREAESQLDLLSSKD